MSLQSNSKIINLPKPLNYQQDIIDMLEQPDIKFVIFLKSRQSGGSFLNKMLVTKWALENKNVKIGYITPTLKLSKRFFKELSISLKPFISNENRTDLIFDFKTGSDLQFFSGESKDAIRGFQFDYVILDEAAFMNTETINLIISPTWMIIGKKVVLCSTPNGNAGFFFDSCQLAVNKEPGFGIKQINIYDNPFISKNEIESKKKQIPERVWRQEYMGEFIDGSGTVFTNYRNCISKTNIIKNITYYAAIDWAKENDYTVVTIINEMKQVVEIYRINKIEYTQQVKLIANKLRQYNVKQVISEENNIGTVVNELLRREWNGIIQKITLNNTLKRQIIEDLCVAFENMDIEIPDHEALLSELQSFTCNYNPSTQLVKYEAPSGLHDDCVISLAYAYYAVQHKMTANSYIF